MCRPDITRIPEWYHGYVNKVKEDNIGDAFRQQSDSFIQFLKNIPVEKINYSYAPGKWSIKELLQHIIDCERVFAYRAMCFARQDKSPLPGFDENEYAKNAHVSHRKWEDMIEEFRSLRQSTELLFASFNNDELESNGIANDKPVYVLGIGFIIAGHTAHHWDIIREKYLT